MTYKKPSVKSFLTATMSDSILWGANATMVGLPAAWSDFLTKSSETQRPEKALLEHIAEAIAEGSSHLVGSQYTETFLTEHDAVLAQIIHDAKVLLETSLVFSTGYLQGTDKVCGVYNIPVLFCKRERSI
jgi:hypothetical protein